MWFLITGSDSALLEQENQAVPETSLLHMLVVASTTAGQCPIHIPSPFLCMPTVTSEWFA